MAMTTSARKEQSMIVYSYKELIGLLKNKDIHLRDINQVRVRMIKKYMLDNALSGHIYFPPLVANLEKLKTNSGIEEKLAIIDGTQRLTALLQLEDLILKAKNSEQQAEIKKGYNLQYLLESTAFAIQVFDNITKEEADQLFIDLNTKGKIVALSKRIAYDSRSLTNQITNAVLTLNEELQIAGVEMEKRAVIRPANKKLLSLSQLRQLVEIFISGKQLSKKMGSDEKFMLQQDEYTQLMHLFLHELFKLYPARSIGNYHQSMLASYPLLLSLVLYINKDDAYLPFQIRKENLLWKMGNLRHVDWSRTNPVWLQFKGSHLGRDQYYYLDKSKENIERLIQWLESKGGEEDVK